jgi:hypothetical protein
VAAALNIAPLEPAKLVQRVGSFVNGLNDAVRDGAYIALGFGVLGFQRAQVRRVELAKQLESRVTSLTSGLRQAR